MHASELAARDVEVARTAGATGEQDGVEVTPQVVRRHVFAYVRTRAEHHAFRRHQVKTTIEHALLHLELGDAVAQQAAHAVGLLEHSHTVTGAIELRSGSEARGA